MQIHYLPVSAQFIKHSRNSIPFLKVRQKKVSYLRELIKDVGDKIQIKYMLNSWKRDWSFFMK
jgi:hypothetical protein